MNKAPQESERQIGSDEMSDRKTLLMRGIIFLIATPLCAVLTYVGGQEEVLATEEAVVVDAPMFWGDEGVRETPYYTGRIFLWPTSTIFRYPNIPLTIIEEFTDLPSKDNVQMDFRIYSVFQLITGAAPGVHDDVGPMWYENRIMKPYRTFIRDKMMSLTADEQRLDSAKLRLTETEILTTVEALLEEAGVQYRVLSVSIGGVTPPDEVLAESARTAAQTQRVKTEMQREAAEIERKAAEGARADADQEYMNKLGISNDQYITMKGYEAYQYAAEKCAKSKNGCTMIVGQPMVDIAVPSPSK
jgi:regulator of protease activity HflC (stomatin/prohibitin superfamily)